MRLSAKSLARVVLIFSLGAAAYWWHGSAPAYIGKRTILVAINQPTTATGTASRSSTPQVMGKKIINEFGASVVARVIDGDTIELETSEKVRYIGVDAPETVHPKKSAQCFGREASKRNTDLAEGKLERLVKDVSETDRYGRLLRYVYLLDG